MRLPNTGKASRRPTHPGSMLREDFLPDYNLSVIEFSRVAWSPQAIWSTRFCTNDASSAPRWRCAWRVYLEIPRNFG